MFGSIVGGATLDPRCDFTVASPPAPTLEHNGLVEMFRENPPLAAHFLALLFHLEVPRHAATRVADATLDQLIPIEFRADLVLELLDEAERVVFAIVLEAQRAPKPRKKFTWPVYVAVARAERECPTVALVLAIDAEVAAWAAEKIDASGDRVSGRGEGGRTRRSLRDGPRQWAAGAGRRADGSRRTGTCCASPCNGHWRR